MELFGFLIGIVVFPAMIVGWIVCCVVIRPPWVVRVIGCVVVLGLPTLAALGVAKWVLLDDPLVTAAQDGNVNRARWLLDHGADPNADSKDGSTALDWAIINHRRAVVELLKSHGAHRGTYPGRTAGGDWEK